MFGRKSGKKKADKPKKEKAQKQPAAAKASRKAKARQAGPVRKLPTNVYTMMLLVSFLSMLVATALMFVEYYQASS